MRTPALYREKLEALVESKTVEDGMIITWGYHHYFHGSLTKQDLDLICPDKPLIVWHRSFHELYMNTTAMAQTEYEVVTSRDQWFRSQVLIQGRRSSEESPPS